MGFKKKEISKKLNLDICIYVSVWRTEGANKAPASNSIIGQKLSGNPEKFQKMSFLPPVDANLHFSIQIIAVCAVILTAEVLLNVQPIDSLLFRVSITLVSLFTPQKTQKTLIFFC